MVYRMYRIQKERRKMTDFAECSMAMQDSGIDPSVDQDNLFLREKENYNSSDCFCSFFYAYGVPDE